jgi:hypothetical protein
LGGFLPTSDFLFFWWWILAICEKCFGRRIPQIYLFLKSTKIANFIAYCMKVYLIFSSFIFWIYCQIWLNTFMDK